MSLILDDNRSFSVCVTVDHTDIWSGKHINEHLCSGVIREAQLLEKGTFSEEISFRFVLWSEWPVHLFDKTLNTHFFFHDRHHILPPPHCQSKSKCLNKYEWISFIIWYFLCLIGDEEIMLFPIPFSCGLDKLIASHSQNLEMDVHHRKLEICTSHYECNWLIILLIKSDEHWVAVLIWLLNATLGINSPTSLQRSCDREMKLSCNFVRGLPSSFLVTLMTLKLMWRESETESTSCLWQTPPTLYPGPSLAGGRRWHHHLCYL